MKVSDVYFDRGDVVYQEGDAPDVVFFIEDGEIEMYRQRGDRIVSVQVMSIGQFVGEIGLLERKSHPMSARAHSDVKCLRIERDELEAEFGKTSPIIRAMMVNLVRKLRHVTDMAYGQVQRDGE